MPSLKKIAEAEEYLDSLPQGIVTDAIVDVEVDPNQYGKWILAVSNKIKEMHHE